MAKIEVPGTFVFENGQAEFVFGSKAITFSRITTIEELRAVLVAIIHYGTQSSIEAIQRPEDSTGEVSSPVASRAMAGIDAVLANSERSFRQHVHNTEAQLRQAQKEYEAATSSTVKQFGSQPT